MRVGGGGLGGGEIRDRTVEEESRVRKWIGGGSRGGRDS